MHVARCCCCNLNVLGCCLYSVDALDDDSCDLDVLGYCLYSVDALDDSSCDLDVLGNYPCLLYVFGNYFYD